LEVSPQPASPLQEAIQKYIGPDFAKSLGYFEKALPIIEKIPGMGKIDSDQFQKLMLFARLIQGDAVQAHKTFEELHTQLGILLDADRKAGITSSNDTESGRTRDAAGEDGVREEHA
jgi:hypothetical protein